MTMLPTISAVLLFSCVSATAVETAVETAEAAAEAVFDVSVIGAFAVSDRLGFIFFTLCSRRDIQFKRLLWVCGCCMRCCMRCCVGYRC